MYVFFHDFFLKIYVSKCILYVKHDYELIRVLAKFLVLYDISSYNEIVVNDIIKDYKIRYIIYAFGKIHKVDRFEFDEEGEIYDRFK